MRCRPIVVLPLPAEPCTAIRARRRLGDELELARIDQRGDRRQVAIGAARARLVDAELAARRGGPRRPRRSFGSRAPGGARRRRQRRGPVARDRQLRLLHGDLAPLPGAQVARERPLRRRHPAQLALEDRDRAPREDLALDQAIAQALLVAVALFVAIEEARHRRVPPVDDLHAAARLDEGARPDEHVAPLAVLLQPQVAEVG